MVSKNLTGLYDAMKISFADHKRIILLSIVVSFFQSTGAIASLTAFVPLLAILSGQDFSALTQLPVVGPIVSSMSDDRETLFYMFLGAIFFLGIFKASLQFGSTLIDNFVKNKVDSDWQKRVIDKWVDAPYQEHESEKSSSIIGLTGMQVPQIGVSARIFVQIISAIVQVGILFTFLAAVSVTALIGVCIVTSLVIIPTILILQKTSNAAQEDVSKVGSYTSHIHDLVKRIELIDVFRTGEREKNKLFTFFSGYTRIRLKFQFFRALIPFVVQIIITTTLSALMLFFLYGGVGEDTLATTILFIGGMAYIHPQLDRISAGAAGLLRTAAAYQAVLPVLSLPERAPDPVASTVDRTDHSAGVEIKNLSFSYGEGDKERKVLDEASVTIASGQFVMLFGATGAGKTTLLRLVQRLLTPDTGQIFFDGHDLQTLSQKDIAKTVLTMQQERPVFTGTIRENITYGHKDVPMESIQDALRLSYADEFVWNLPQGLDSQVGNDGAFLSGGQRQRISLARVLISDPKVLLLDEPTSALDRDSERNVLAGIEEIADRGRTVIMSTHKVELAPLADRVIWFHEGKLAIGTFADFQKTLVSFDQSHRSIRVGG